MNENLENNEWMDEAPALAARVKKNPFLIPEGYFESGTEAIRSAIFMERLREKTNENRFEVPPDYFEELSARIQTQITLTEKISPVRSFTMPDQYFDTLQDKIQAKIQGAVPKKEAKVFKLWRSNLVKYASAACFLLIASFSFYAYQNSELNKTQVLTADQVNEQMLYDIDESMIIEHLEAQNPSQETATSASDTEVENYLLNNYSPNDLTQELKN